MADLPSPPINQPIGGQPLPPVWQAYLKALEAELRDLRARIAALEGP